MYGKVALINAGVAGWCFAFAFINIIAKANYYGAIICFVLGLMNILYISLL